LLKNTKKKIDRIWRFAAGAQRDGKSHRDIKKNRRRATSRGTPEFSPLYTDTIGIALRYLVSERTVSNWIRQRRIPFLKLGRAVRFDVTKCDAAVARFEVREIK
jgi:excisionase family DNA binding protein